VEAQGAAACLLKPFDLNALLTCVATHIRLGHTPPALAA
jgi:hypothetical protein